LEEAGIKAIPTGIEHGTVTAVSHGKPYEITTLRRDRACDGRHAEVEFTDDWFEDAARRDLSINAMSATPDGAVYDYFNGIDHLARGLIRFIGIPKRRLEEDYLRILRYFRFLAHYGRGGANKEALAAIRVAAPQVETLSRERIREEILRILEADGAAEVLLLMHSVRVLDFALPEATEFGALRVLIWLETRAIRLEGIEPNTLRRLSCLLPNGEAAHCVAERLKLSNAQRDHLLAIAAVPQPPDPSLGDGELRHLLYELGPDLYRDCALITWARKKSCSEHGSSTETEAWISLLERPNRWSPPDFPLTGADVLGLGVPEGPEVGRLLDTLRTSWVSEDFRPERPDLLARLEAHVREG
ncbi:MAG: hypothetical protein A2516_05275, partial [Alphaproteobacteria bacterium RIFOXYD12_FULL_60_8]